MTAHLPELSDLNDLRYGRDPILDAWILHFMTENNLEYRLTPHLNATPEQIRFMVDLDEDQIFLPCTDEVFRLILQPRMPDELRRRYNKCWRDLVSLIKTHDLEENTRRRIVQFCRHRYRQHLASHIIIPSRLSKRLTSIFVTQSDINDPFREKKRACNMVVHELLQQPAMDGLLNNLPDPLPLRARLRDFRFELEKAELKRLFILSSSLQDWPLDVLAPTPGDLAHDIAVSCAELDFDDVGRAIGPGTGGPKTILYLPGDAGAILLDIMVCRLLMRQGYRIILAVKDGFFFNAATIWDVQEDPVLVKALEGAKILLNDRVSKNELIQALREHRLVVVSDGAQERLNLYRASVTFARAWKEADLVVAKGEYHWRRLIMTSHQFTRDVLCFTHDGDGRFHLRFKPKSTRVRKFTETDLLEMAGEIIERMRRARKEGKSVMFYSAIIGSIPGQTKTAIQLLSNFVPYLRSRLEGSFIVNPAEHFVPGMDGDDLMFMWERVQRSGLINVWRFQTDADIEKSFELLGRKVPPEWAGKDATFSTGCTKEMGIALEMQVRHPEMQIIGPSSEKFFRRKDYGVGKYFDAAIPT